MLAHMRGFRSCWKDVLTDNCCQSFDIGRVSDAFLALFRQIRSRLNHDLQSQNLRQMCLLKSAEMVSASVA